VPKIIVIDEVMTNLMKK